MEDLERENGGSAVPQRTTAGGIMIQHGYAMVHPSIANPEPCITQKRKGITFVSV